MSLEQLDDHKFLLSIDATGKKNLLCSDFMLFGNAGVFSYEMLFFEGVTKITFDVSETGFEKAAFIDMKANGIESFAFCEDIGDELISVLNTLKLYAGGIGRNGIVGLFDTHTPDYLAEINREFIKWGHNWDVQKRETEDFVIDERLIKSGDFFPVLRLDGLDPMVMYGTGSRVGHTTVALWFEEFGKRELYIVESQAGVPYWPVDRIQRTKYRNWVRLAKEASFLSTHLPLSEEKRAQFNETAATEAFYEL